MAKLKLLNTIFSKLSSLSKNDGQIVVTRDSKSLYIDLEGERIEITDWINVDNEESLLAILSPLTNKYYYTKDTNKIWRYVGSEWICLNNNINEMMPTYIESTTLTKLKSGEKISVAFGKISKAVTDLISHIGDSIKHITSEERTNWDSAKTHADSTHARTDATKVEKSTTNGNIKINGSETNVYTHPSGTNPHGTTKSDVGLGNVGNFKAVSTVASQGLTDTEKSNARTNIGAGTSSFSGSYNDLSNKPTIPTVGNGTVTIKQAGTSKGTFTMNQSGDTTIELTDNNTWRGIQNNLTSDSTTDSLSAAQGKVLKTLIDDIEVGGRNLLKNSTIHGSSSGYEVGNYYLTETFSVNATYTISANITVNGKKSVSFYLNGENIGLTPWINMTDNSTNTYTATFTATQQHVNSITSTTLAKSHVVVFTSNNSSSGQDSTAITGSAVVNWIKLEKGNTPTDWTPAPEDLTYQSEFDDLKMLGWAVPMECPVQNFTTRNQFTQLVDRVDLGSLDWTYQSNGEGYVFVSNQLNFLQSNIANNDVKYKAYCIDYIIVSANYLWAKNIDKTIAFAPAGNCLRICNKSYTDVASFKQYLQAKKVYLYYELATPIMMPVEGNEIATHMDNIKMLGWDTPRECPIQNTVFNGMFTQKVGRYVKAKLVAGSQMDTQTKLCPFAAISDTVNFNNTEASANSYCQKLGGKAVSLVDARASNGICFTQYKTTFYARNASIEQTVSAYQTWFDSLGEVSIYYELATPVTKNVDGNELYNKYLTTQNYINMSDSVYLANQQEKAIGTWIDGSPLYQCTVPVSLLNGTEPPTATTVDLEHLNIKDVISIRGMLKHATGTYIECPYVVTDNNYVSLQYYSSHKGLAIVNGKNSSGTLHVTIQYTKN